VVQAGILAAILVGGDVRPGTVVLLTRAAASLKNAPFAR